MAKVLWLTEKNIQTYEKGLLLLMEEKKPGQGKRLLAILRGQIITVGVGVTITVSDRDTVCGMLATHQVLTLTRNYIEIHDVFVIASARGKGMESALITEVMASLQDELQIADSVFHVRLTSGPHRAVENILYEKMGFKKLAYAGPFGTNLYELIIAPT